MRRSTLLTRGTGVRIADTVPPTPVATCEWAADTLGSFPSPTGAVRSRCRASCISCPWLAIRVCLGTASMRLPGGLDSGGTLGAPVSLGCIRLNKFQAKLARWWTPSQAKFFVYFEPNRYRAFGDAATGRAKGFRTPQDPEMEIAAAPPRPAYRIVSNRAKNTFAPFGLSYLVGSCMGATARVLGCVRQ